MKRRLVFVGVGTLLVGMACLCSGAIPDLGGGGVLPVPPDDDVLPPDIDAPPPAVGGNCDALSTPIQTGSAFAGSLAATQEEYPANCAYYCVWVADGTSALDLSLSNFEVDLDMYVGTGDITSVRGAEPGDTPWLSNEFGTDDEFISIPNPSASAAYYIEICSYEGAASGFNLEATAR